MKKVIRMSDSSIRSPHNKHQYQNRNSPMQLKTPLSNTHLQPKTNTNPTTFEQNFKIYLRIKPIIIQQPSAQNINNNNNPTHRTNKLPEQCIKIHSKKRVEIIPPYYTSDQDKIYNYEEVFNGRVDNGQVFEKAMVVPILNVLSGYNSTVFIYGMTGSGKTYSMFGSDMRGCYGSPKVYKCERDSNNINDEEDNENEKVDEGLAGLTLEYMFKQIKSKKQVQTQVFLSFFQIYNQNIRDLLQQSSQNLNVMQDPQKGVIINDLKQLEVQSEQAAKLTIMQGLQRRAMNATKSNEVSSRSHAIMQFSVRRYVSHEDTNQIEMLQSKFFMIDLAGNQKTGNNQSKRFIQGVNINKSLLTLGKCISILAQQKKNCFVPFRDSKLTRILKESLGGNSKTVMIACISSEKKFYEETLNTLKYSTIAKRIKNKGIKNNVKMISKNQMPSCSNLVNEVKTIGRQYVSTQKKSEHAICSEAVVDEQEQKRVSDLMGRFVIAIQDKITMEKLRKDLQFSKEQNVSNIQNGIKVDQSRKYVMQINTLLQKISKQYAENLKKAQDYYQTIQNQLLEKETMKKQKPDLNANIPQASNENKQEINRLYKIINEQERRIHELEENGDKGKVSCLKEQSMNITAVNTGKTMYNSIPGKENCPYRKRGSFEMNANTSSNKINPRKKHPELTIQCTPVNESYQEFTTTQMQSYTTSHMASQQPQITIKLQSNRNKVDHESRDEFIKRLKQTEKRAKGGCDEDVSRLLEQQEKNNYELGNIQLSMLRKLKFFQKERPLKKSHSVGGNNALTTRGNSYRNVYKKL